MKTWAFHSLLCASWPYTTTIFFLGISRFRPTSPASSWALWDHTSPPHLHPSICMFRPTYFLFFSFPFLLGIPFKGQVTCHLHGETFPKFFLQQTHLFLFLGSTNILYNLCYSIYNLRCNSLFLFLADCELFKGRYRSHSTVLSVSVPGSECVGVDGVKNEWWQWHRPYPLES